MTRRVHGRLHDAFDWWRDATRRMDAASVRLYAAAVAYRTIFSVVAFTATVILIGYLLGIDTSKLGREESRSGALEAIARDRMEAAIELGSTSIILAGVVGLGIGLYGMSGGFAAICEVLDRIHGTQRYVRMTVRYLRGALVATVFVGLISVAVLLLSITRSLGDFVLGALGLQRIAGLTAFVLGIVIPAIAVYTAFVFANRYASHARPPWWQALTGALVATIAWIVLFFCFVEFTTLVRPFDTYGALASAVALLLFGYMQAYVLILTNLFAVDILRCCSLLPGVQMSRDDRSLTVGFGARHAQ